MHEIEFWKLITLDEANMLDRLLEVLDAGGFRYCVVGGQAVNAYVEPLVSLDLDLVVASEQLSALEQALAEDFEIERFAHSLNVSLPGSDLRVQFKTDPRYPDFVNRASRRMVLGREVPVASIEDVIAGKIWAASDATRRASKRQKDLADIARLVEAYPRLRAEVPAELLDRLVD